MPTLRTIMQLRNLKTAKKIIRNYTYEKLKIFKTLLQIGEMYVLFYS